MFTDFGKATFETSPGRAAIGSYGISFRLAIAPLAVLRLDVGRRFSSNDFQGYGLDRDQRDGDFVSFFFGTNY